MGLYSQLEIDFDLDIVEDFVNHYALMCENLEPLIIDLNKPEKYEDNIGELFRIFHNLKSAGGFLKLDPIVKLSTLSEDVAEEARVVKGPASEEFIDWLLLISDQFEVYRQDIEQDKEYFSMLNPLIIKVPVQLEK
ncbi:MAG: Hpt domain-containing protein [Campylobacteraceae bacterium]|nr:Hpt domain-containing protein [Campylobacteraceae bacterium]